MWIQQICSLSTDMLNVDYEKLGEGIQETYNYVKVFTFK